MTAGRPEPFFPSSGVYLSIKHDSGLHDDFPSDVDDTVLSVMDDDLDTSPPLRSWPDEDKTPTSQREIWGFYSYSIAAEVFAVVGVGAFLPVTLEQLARENGVLYSDRTTPCVSHDAGARSLMPRATDGEREADQCLVRILGVEVTTASFAMYTFSAAVLCQALVLVSISAFADYGGNRKRLLLTFGSIGALTSMSFLLMIPAIYLMAALLVIVGITCLGSSFVVLNSYLPLLSTNHPLARDKHESVMQGDTSALQISTEISSRAVGLGYAAAVFVQVLGIGMLVILKQYFDDDSTVPLRMILALSGVWWATFLVPAALWLRTRPGPPFDEKSLSVSESGIGSVLAHVRFAWSSLWRTIKLAVQLKQMVIFLIAWFFLSDAQASVSGTAVLFAKTELKIGSIGIAMMSITVMTSGILGATMLPIVSRRMAWNSNQTIICCLCVMELIPLYGLLAYIPFIKSWGVGGVQVWWEIYICAFMFGFVMGGLSSYCRSLYGSLVPPGSEATFFALFAITDKGSSALGPAVIGRIIDATGHIRPAFFFLAAVIAVPIPLLWRIDLTDGQADAVRMSVRLGEAQGTSVRLGGSDRYEDADNLLDEYE